MNTQQLHCFVCVADKLNFTKAAEELFLSAPTVTHHIKSLEQELDVRLFIRTSKMVKLTECGTIFYNDAKDILDKIEFSQKRARKAAAKDSSFLRIGCTSNAELNRLQSILCSLQDHFPQVYPQITVDDYFSLKNLFQNKQLDLMLATREMVKDMKDCTFQKIKEILNFAVLSEKSHLSEFESLTFNHLKDCCLITLHPKFIPFQYGNKLQEKIALHSQAHFNIVCENDQACILLARSGYGIAILPEFCIPAERPGLIIRPVAEENKIEYGILSQKKSKEIYIKYFLNHFKPFPVI